MSNQTLIAEPGSPDEGGFRIESGLEIAEILRALTRSRAPVTAHFDGGREFLVTALLSVEDRGFVVLDSASNPELNERMLRGAGVTVVSNQDGVRVQFTSDRIQATSYDGRLAFRVPLPGSLVKLQRREFSRLPTPRIQPPRWEFTSAKGERFELPLADVGLGGVCLEGEAQGLTLEPGIELAGCRVTLPAVGTIQVRLCVRSRYTITRKNGLPSRRTGCEFVDLSPQQETLVQRYILRLERERRGKRSDSDP